MTFSILPPTALRAASAATLLLLLSAAGCGGEDGDVEASAQETPEASPQPVSQPTALQQFDFSTIGYNEGTEETAAFGVIEFADFGCIHCSDFHRNTYPALHTEFIASGELLWKYIPVTLAGFPNGDLAGISAVCAAERGRFAPMRDYLFGKREEWLASTRGEELFVEYAVAVGLSAGEFRTCLTGPDARAELVENDRIARQIGVIGTPTFIVAGTPVEGAPPLENFQTALRQLISEARSAAPATPAPPASPGPVGIPGSPPTPGSLAPVVVGVAAHAGRAASVRAASVTPVLALLLATAWGCSPALVAFSAPCSPAGPVRLLPPEIGESSGIAASRAHPGLLWTHNDASGDGPLFLVDLRGALVGAVRLEGASVRDWEDLGVGPCGLDGRGSCLYLADTGDNAERRDDPAIYRLPEPAPDATTTATAERFALRFPNGPRDVEAMFILPDERLFLVTKGRNNPVELYRVPPFPSAPTAAGNAQASTAPLLLERIQTLTEDPPPLPRWITGASASADGRFVALRSYETLQLYHPDADGRLAPVPEGLLNLRIVGEIQGEGVAFASEGDLVLTSEEGPLGGRGTIATLRCQGTDPA